MMGHLQGPGMFVSLGVSVDVKMREINTSNTIPQTINASIASK